MTDKILKSIGKKFGKLTIIEFDHYGPSSSAYYRCKCDCGNEVIVKRQSLISGATKTCRMCSTKELIGKRFGKLTVTKYTGKNSRNSHTFECKCDCGNIVFNVQAYSLTNGHTKSCGKCTVFDTIGKKFGHLTPIKLVPIPDDRKRYTEREKSRYLCQCDCGNTTIVRGNSLRNNVTSTCGKCYHGLPDSYKPEIYKRCLYLSDVYYSIRLRCENPENTSFSLYGGRGIKCNLDRMEFIKKYYKENIEGLEVDRIDNNGDYSLDNIRWVSSRDNNMNRMFNEDYTFDMTASRLMSLNTLHKLNINHTKYPDDEFFFIYFGLYNKSGNKLYIPVHYTIANDIKKYCDNIVDLYDKFGMNIYCKNIFKIKSDKDDMIDPKVFRYNITFVSTLEEKPVKQ